MKPWSEILQYLEISTGLNYTLLPDNFISITPGDSKICGYLKDSVSQEVIPFATIWHGNNSTISNQEGFFELTLGQKHNQLNIRHVSYFNKKIPINKPTENRCLEIFLSLNQQILAEIVVSDYLITGIDKLNNGAYKIDFGEFSILPGLIEPDVLQSVQAFPGILSANETVSNINIRGGSHDQNLILWDDIKMYQSGHFFGLISMYNPQITQSVSLRKNGSPAAFNDGVSGTIDMKTEKEINKRFKGNFGINFIDANGFLDIPLGNKSSVQVAARKSISELVETPTYSEYFDRISQDTELESDSAEVRNSDKNFDFYDGSVRWIYKPSKKDELRVNFIYTSNELQFNENALVANQEVSKQSSLNQLSIAGGLQYRRSWTDRHVTTFNIYETDYQLKAVNANILDDQRFLQENKVSETGVGLQSNYKIRQQIQWNNGYQFVETKVTNLDDVDNPVYRKLIAEVVRTHGLFSEIGWVSLNKVTNFNLGGRLNYFEKFNKFSFEPRASFNHQFLRWFNLEILGEFKHQNTSQVINFQNDFLGIEKRRWQLSDNDTIPIITSRQASLGISYQKNGWLLNAVGFIKLVKGITTQSQGFQNQYQFVKEKGNLEAKGIDLLIRKQFTNINTWLGYSFLNSDYTFDQLESRSFPGNFDVTHAISLGTTYSYQPFLFSAGLNWHSGKPISRPSDPAAIDGEIKYDAPNSNRLPYYLRIDLSAIYQMDLGDNTKAEFGFSIWNLLDRENPINSFYRIDATGKAKKIVQNSLSLTPNVSFKVYF